MTREELAELDGDKRVAIGRTIYREKIYPLVYPQHEGKVVIIDLATGDYAMDYTPTQAHERLNGRRILCGLPVSPTQAHERLMERRPDCFYTYMVGVGNRDIYGLRRPRRLLNRG